MNILVLENEVLVMRALVRVLEKRGHTCFMAPSVAIANAFLLNATIDVILCDRDLDDGENGWEWAKHSTYRVVYMTGGGVDPGFGFVFRKGIDDVATLFTLLEH